MKKLAMFFSMLAASLLLSALPAFSGMTGPYGGFGPDLSSVGGVAEHIAFSGMTGPYGGYGPDLSSVGGTSQFIASSSATGPYGLYSPEAVGEQFMANKDECLLVAMNCPNDFSTQQRIDRLNTEISKGTSVYTPDELNMLKKELNDAYGDLNRGGMNKGY